MRQAKSFLGWSALFFGGLCWFLGCAWISIHIYILHIPDAVIYGMAIMGWILLFLAARISNK